MLIQKQEHKIYNRIQIYALNQILIKEDLLSWKLPAKISGWLRLINLVSERKFTQNFVSSNEIISSDNQPSKK